MKKLIAKIAISLFILIVIFPLVLLFLAPIVGWVGKSAAYTVWTLSEPGCCVTLRDLSYEFMYAGGFLVLIWACITSITVVLVKVFAKHKKRKD